VIGSLGELALWDYPPVLAQLEAKRFVGRDEELARLERVLDPDAAAPIVFVHGPGGIGKSALLRELSRRAAGRDFAVRGIDGRDSDAAQAAIEPALQAMRDGSCSLLLLDTYEQIAALGALLRRDLESALAAGGRLVIAGRRPPEPAWLEDGWQEAVLSLRLAPLSQPESQILLDARGIGDDVARQRLVAWGEGSPLALSVAADTLLAGNTLDLERLDADGLLASTLVSRLAGTELAGADHDIVAVAAIARAVDAQLLAAALPGVDGDHAEAWLRSLSFAEPLGTRITLHERVRKAVRTALLAEDPEHERQLRRRIADYLYGRAALGELRLLVDIAELIDDPTVRWGLAPPPIDVRPDRVRPGDREKVEEMVGAAGSEWWVGTRRWFEQAPEHIIVVRDAADVLVGWGIWVTPANAPEWVEEDAILAPWLADARSRVPDGDVLLFRDCPDDLRELADGEESPVLSAANLAIALSSGVRRARYMYGTTEPGRRQTHEFLLALNFERLPELDVEDGERTVCSYFVDWGPGGLVQMFRDLAYTDLGISPPTPAAGAAMPADSVRDALRSFHDPIALAASPLGRGGSGDERAASVQSMLRQATLAAFGDSPEQRLQRQAIERGYLDPDGGHARAMLDLSVSRTTYFRRLAEASEQLTRYVLANRQ
jgi:hypothetical protein